MKTKIIYTYGNNLKINSAFQFLIQFVEEDLNQKLKQSSFHLFYVLS